MTETVSHIALRKLTPPDASPYFKVLGDTQIGTNERGCLRIKGAITGQEWLNTNDLVEIADEKHFRWLGRYDFVINSGGVKVSPETVEAVLEPIVHSLGFNGRLLISSLPDEKLGERIVLLLEGDSPGENFKARLLAEAKQQLVPYHAPKEVYYLSAFAQTNNGKIQRRKTQDLLLRIR
jgi:O-succinylbenzoic acid--CoA ligase